MQAALSIDAPSWNRQDHRLVVCMAISTGLLLVIGTFDWPAWFELPQRIPLELEITLRRPPPQIREPSIPETQPPPAAPAVTEPHQAAAAAEPQAAAAVERPAVATPQPGTASQPDSAATQPANAEAPVDWYAELERASAAVTASAAAEPQSMHPEFDELRRIAALRYGKPRTGKPPTDWEVEKDSYGRTLLRRGNTYMVLDDPSVFNRYAFETFERHMLFFTVPFGKQRPQNLPWVEAIRARYEYLREPDELPALKVSPKMPDP